MKGNVATGPVGPGPQISVPRERHTIWQGIIEWVEKAKTPADKQTRHLPCQVSVNSKDGDADL